jgi:hypothetical protein
MNWGEEIKFLCCLGLNIFIFRKKIHGGNVFVVVTRSDGDELYHPETLPKPDLDRLRNWIRCGDPTPGLISEWRDVDISGLNIKAYIAGENPGIDCTSVADDMFAEEGGKKITYVYRHGKTNKIKEVSHPEYYVNLSTAFPLLPLPPQTTNPQRKGGKKANLVHRLSLREIVEKC